MRSRLPVAVASSLVALLVITVAATPPHRSSKSSNVADAAPGFGGRVASGVGPALQSIGALAIGPNRILYAADPQAATVFALDLSKLPASAPGTANIDGVDNRIAATLGTAASEISIADLKIDPATRNAYVAVMRGQGTGAAPALVRIDGTGKIELLPLDNVSFQSVSLPNPPSATPSNGRSNRSQSITHLAYSAGRVLVAGLSNEEFASKLWALPYPFEGGDRGTSVEIFHGSHGRLETRSPVYTFVPYTVDGQPDLIAAYLCTPLVRFPLSSLKPGAKVRGTTIAELGAGNRPIDMVLYSKDGNQYLLMSNTSRGVMKIPTRDFGTQDAITTPISGTAGIAYETVASMTGVQQLDLLDATHSIVVTKTPAGTINLQSVALP